MRVLLLHANVMDEADVVHAIGKKRWNQTKQRPNVGYEKMRRTRVPHTFAKAADASTGAAFDVHHHHGGEPCHWAKTMFNERLIVVQPNLFHRSQSSDRAT